MSSSFKSTHTNRERDERTFRELELLRLSLSSPILSQHTHIDDDVIIKASIAKFSPLSSLCLCVCLCVAHKTEFQLNNMFITPPAIGHASLRGRRRMRAANFDERWSASADGISTQTHTHTTRARHCVCATNEVVQ